MALSDATTEIEHIVEIEKVLRNILDRLSILETTVETLTTSVEELQQ